MLINKSGVLQYYMRVKGILEFISSSNVQVDIRNNADSLIAEMNSRINT